MIGTKGKWHGKKFYFGFHSDLHVTEKDRNIGTYCNPGKLIPILKKLKADFIQVDCKGHYGLTSWFSETPTATIGSGVKKDALKGWRQATTRLNIPLHCHYSDLVDVAAGKKFPDWSVLDKEGKLIEVDAKCWEAIFEIGNNSRVSPGGYMCTRSPYLDQLMLPQLLELIDNWGINGFWIDGDLWAVVPCYCARCREAFSRQTGKKAPKDTKDPEWPKWIEFTRLSFEKYVTKYCEAVHKHKPGVLVCSAWLQTLYHPGEPKVPTDWISGDVGLLGLNRTRCEARFISTRNKPWDLMLTGFYKISSYPDIKNELGDTSLSWEVKPVSMLKQEAAVILALGGNVQICEITSPFRDGRFIPWRMERFRELGNFVKARRSLCQDTETVPQVVVLHSEHHYYNNSGATFFNSGISDTLRPVEGATCSLLGTGYNVDLMDEWALLPQIDRFPLVVVPEQDNMSDKAINVLKDYVTNGGRLLLTGVAAYERFGSTFLGVESQEVQNDALLCLPVGKESTRIWSQSWRLLKPTTAIPTGYLSQDQHVTVLPYPASTVNKVGEGTVTYIPADIFRFFQRTHYPSVQNFIKERIRQILNKQVGVFVKAPACVDVVLRKKANKLIIHLINCSSGYEPGVPVNEEILVAGPIEIVVDLKNKFKKVRIVSEGHPLKWRYFTKKTKGKGNKLVIRPEGVHIHSIIVVELF